MKKLKYKKLPWIKEEKRKQVGMKVKLKRRDKIQNDTEKIEDSIIL